MKKRGMVIGALLLITALSVSVLSAFESTAAAGGSTVRTPEPAVIAGPTVTITNFTFTPKVVRVKAGTEVTWQVKEGTHTVTADNGSFESPALSAGKSFTHKFATAGTYRYYCSFHGSKGGHDMAGTVVVAP